MALANDSAGTAAELDELEKQLAAIIKLQAGTGFVRLKLGTAHAIADAIAALRRERDEARRSLDAERTAILRKNAEADRMSDAYAQMAAALRRIEQNSEPGSRNNRIARHALGIEPVDPTLTASQEAPASPKDVHIEHTLATSPSPGLREPTDEDWAALEALGAGGARVRRVRAPSPGLREAVIEECAKAIEGLPTMMAASPKHVKATGPKECAAAIRALAATGDRT